MAVSSAGEEPAPPLPTWPERLIERSPRATWGAGLTLWGIGALLFALHAYHLALPDPVRFSMLDSWVIGLGCLGCPVLALRALGRHLTPNACLFIGGVCLAIAALLTGLTLVGEMHPKPMNATFGLILPLALGIHAVNAADVEMRAARRERAAYQSGRIDAVAGLVEQRYAAVAGLERLDAMDLAGLKTLADIVAAHIAARATEPRSLHLVAEAGEDRAGRDPPMRICALPPSYAGPRARGSPQGHREGAARTDLS